MKILANYFDNGECVESVLYEEDELSHVLTEKRLEALEKGHEVSFEHEGVQVTLSPVHRYKIVRFYKRLGVPSKTIKYGLTLEEAQAHCSSDDTKGKDQDGDWFDGFVKEE